MNKVYLLSNCDSCRKIINGLPDKTSFIFHDIKENPITDEELNEMHKLAGSYERLFSKRAQLYKTLNLKNSALSEDDYRSYILQHYTFLSRPVFIIEGKIYIGNSPKVIEEIHNALV